MKVLRILIQILPSSSQNIKKNGDFYVLWLLPLKNVVNVASESNKQRNLEKFFFLVAVLQVTDENRMIRSRIR